MLRRRTALLPSLVAAAGLACVSSAATPAHPLPPAPPLDPAVTIAVDGASPRAVPLRHGQNYWCWNGYGNRMPAIAPMVKPLGLTLLRAGGYNNDAEKSLGGYGSDPFGPKQIDAFVAYARAAGAEPVLQVPLIANYKRHRGKANPAAAAALVTYVNVTKRHGVKYWEIGNEPDLYADRDIKGYTVDRYIADFKAFATAMKAVDPTIQLLGPELSWKYYPTQPKDGPDDWLTPFVRQCKGYYDILAIHRYPFDAKHCTVDAAMGDVDTFVKFVQDIQALIAAEAPGVPFAITEANITWDGDPAHMNYPASPPTLHAALWLADNLAAARDLGLWAQTYWSLSEGWMLGFVDGSGRPRPQYHAFQLVSRSMGPTALAASAPAGLSAYASRSPAGDATVVLALNKRSADARASFTFREVSGSPAAGFTAALPAYSMSVITFPDGGGAPRVVRYSPAEADAGKPPVEVP